MHDNHHDNPDFRSEILADSEYNPYSTTVSSNKSVHRATINPPADPCAGQSLFLPPCKDLKHYLSIDGFLVSWINDYVYLKFLKYLLNRKVFLGLPNSLTFHEIIFISKLSFPHCTRCRSPLALFLPFETIGSDLWLGFSPNTDLPPSVVQPAVKFYFSCCTQPLKELEFYSQVNIGGFWELWPLTT